MCVRFRNHDRIYASLRRRRVPEIYGNTTRIGVRDFVYDARSDVAPDNAAGSALATGFGNLGVSFQVLENNHKTIDTGFSW